MLRLAYYAFLYCWYGGRPSSLSEELTAESSDVHDSASAAVNVSRGNGASGGHSTSPALASRSQPHDPATNAIEVSLWYAERGESTTAQVQNGREPSSLSELTTEVSDANDSAVSSSTSSVALIASQTNGMPEGNRISPAPASGSQPHDPHANAAPLWYAERGESTSVHVQDARESRSGDKKLRRLLKRASIVDKLTTLTALTSIVSDLDLCADWYFLKEGLEGESPLISYVALAFTVIGTVMYALLAVEFHFVSKAWTCWRNGRALSPLQHVPLGWQLFLNVVVEDIPQLVITCLTSPTSTAGVLNIATAGFALLAKIAEGFSTRRDLPMCAQLRMIEEDPRVVRHMMVQRRNAEKLAAGAAHLAVLVNNFGLETNLKRQTAFGFQIMQLEPGFLNGKLNYVREKLDKGAGVDVTGSQLTGPIPSVLGELTSLQKLVLGYNELTGTIPPELGVLTALQTLDLHSNALTGLVPPELGGMMALETLDLRANNLHGTIPPELGRLTALQTLNLAGNQLTGPIPPALGELKALHGLLLFNNFLDDEIPPVLGQLTALERLYLNNNNLHGSIPPELANVTALQTLWLSGNDLNGTIPPELGRLTALQTLNLAGNQLTGPIPPALGGLTALEGLFLYRNKLNGPLPSTLGGLTALERLCLNHNNLNGSIPGELGQLQVLEEATLAGNNFSGKRHEVQLILPSSCTVLW